MECNRVKQNTALILTRTYIIYHKFHIRVLKHKGNDY